MPGLGIAAASEVRSVLLVSTVSREKIRSVALDPASRTSAVLTRILLKRRVRSRARVSRDGASRGRRTDAQPRSSGIPALKTRLNGHVVLDLAAEWRAFSGHPFVFAFWAVARRVPRRPRSPRCSRARPTRPGSAHFPRLVREEAAESGLSEPVVEDYLRHALHYELDAGDLEGLALFYRLAAEEGLIPAARPLAFV